MARKIVFCLALTTFIFMVAGVYTVIFCSNQWSLICPGGDDNLPQTIPVCISAQFLQSSEYIDLYYGEKFYFSNTTLNSTCITLNHRECCEMQKLLPMCAYETIEGSVRLFKPYESWHWCTSLGIIGLFFGVICCLMFLIAFCNK